MARSRAAAGLVFTRTAGICNTDLNELIRGYMQFRGVLGHNSSVCVDGPLEGIASSADRFLAESA
jgi:hypothetical protein